MPIDKDIKQLQDGGKAASGDHLHNFYKAPIEPIEEPPKLRKNKNSPFESPLVPDIDEKMRRMKVEGLNSIQISAELAKQGTLITWQRIQRRLAFMDRKKQENVPLSPRTKSESISRTAKMVSSQNASCTKTGRASGLFF